MPSQYALRSAGTRSSIPPATPRRRASSESSPLTPSPEPDLGPRGLEKEDPMRIARSGEPHAPCSVGHAMLSAPSNDEVEAQDDDRQLPFYTPEHESAPASGTEGSRLVLDPAIETDDGIWTTVVKRLRRKGAQTPLVRKSISKGNSDLARTLSKAEQCLSTEDRLRIQMREEVEASACRAETESSNEEELVDRKGKGPDPANWEQLDIHGDDLDINVQCTALTQWNEANKAQKHTEDAPSTESDEPPGPSESTVTSPSKQRKCLGKTQPNQKTWLRRAD